MFYSSVKDFQVGLYFISDRRTGYPSFLSDRRTKGHDTPLYLTEGQKDIIPPPYLTEGQKNIMYDADNPVATLLEPLRHTERDVYFYSINCTSILNVYKRT